MINKPTLLSEMLKEKNRLFNEDQSFTLTKLLTNLLFSNVIVLLITSFGLIIASDFLNIYFNLTFNEYASFCFGNTCFYYSFKLIKEKTIPYYTCNPILLIGIIYPSFFNGALIQNTLEYFNLISFDLRLFFIVISIILYYLILNYYFQKINTYKSS